MGAPSSSSDRAGLRTTHFVANGALQTAYQEAGTGDPFVFVHGFTGSKLDFQDQLDWFGDLRRCIAYDQRGHGETTNLKPYTFDKLVGDLVGLLDTLDIERCDLLGHSLGGMVAMRAVLAHPDRFRSLVLMDTAAEPVSAASADMRQGLVRRAAEEGCVALLDTLRTLPSGPGVQSGIDFLGEAEHWRRVQVKLLQLDVEAFAEFGEQLANHASVLEAVGAVRCPTTVLVGEHDEPFIAASQRLAERIPGAYLVTLAGAGHCPQYENAPAWRDAIRAHLARTAS